MLHRIDCDRNGDAVIATPSILLIKAAHEAYTLKRGGRLKELCPKSSLQETIELESCQSERLVGEYGANWLLVPNSHGGASCECGCGCGFAVVFRGCG